jgi:four helix bundle protein
MPSRNMLERTFQFAVEVALLIQKLPYNQINKAYVAQLVRCSSSVGANYRASQRAKSTNDFINKLKIVEEEADESIYFLQLLSALNITCRPLIEPLIKEGEELLKIIVASIKTTRYKTL